MWTMRFFSWCMPASTLVISPSFWWGTVLIYVVNESQLKHSFLLWTVRVVTVLYFLTSFYFYFLFTFCFRGGFTRFCSVFINFSVFFSSTLVWQAQTNENRFLGIKKLSNKTIWIKTDDELLMLTWANVIISELSHFVPSLCASMNF